MAMPGLEGIGKILIIIGIVVAVLGLLMVFGGRIPFLGKLPGDILIQKMDLHSISPSLVCCYSALS